MSERRERNGRSERSDRTGRNGRSERSDPTTDPYDHGRRHESAGSLGEEAARLAEAVREWAARGGFGEHLDAGLGAALGSVRGAGFATGSAECRLCPICQLVAVVRATRPEVYGHLADALASLGAAARELAATERARSPRAAGVEHIDIS